MVGLEVGVQRPAPTIPFNVTRDYERGEKTRAAYPKYTDKSAAM